MNKPNIKQRLRGSFFALIIVGALIVGALFALPSAKAAPPRAASGNTTDCENLISVRSSGPNTIVVLSIATTFTGTFDGTWEGTERDVFHPNGSGTGQGSGVFSGSVDGRSGTMVFSYEVSISPAGKVVTRWTVGQGTGDLAGVHGEGTFPDAVETGPTGDCEWDTFALEYDGRIQFAP